VLFGRQLREEGADFRSAKFARMTPAVKYDESPNPVNVGVFGSTAVVSRPNRQPHTIEKFGLLGLHDDDDAIVAVEPTSELSKRTVGEALLELPYIRKGTEARCLCASACPS